jgi:putative isomerase
MADVSRRSVLRSVSSACAAAALPTGLAPRVDASRHTEKAGDRKSAAKPLMEYFRQNAPKLLRSAQGPLKHPSIAPSLPGKEYSAELWDWDTLWTARGLFRFANLAQDKAFHDEVVVHARGSLLDFFEHQTPEGRLPLVINAAHPLDGALPYKAPNYQNQAKPVMGQLALLVADEAGTTDELAPIFESLLRFYDSWILGNMTGTGLLVWGDDVSIGNDNDPTTFGRPFFSSANLLLNTFFYQDLRAAVSLGQRLGRPVAELDLLNARADALGKAIQEHCWDARDGFYYTVDVQCQDRRSELLPGVPQGMAMSWSTIPLRLQVFTGFLPLWCGLASKEQAATMMRRNYFADDRFRANFGVRSLSNLESMYSMAFSGNPSNWLGPVWIIVNYLTWKGLTAYGYDDAADELADKTVRLLTAGLQKDGSLNEYYHPDSGAPLSHKGFMDWNLLVLEMI